MRIACRLFNDGVPAYSARGCIMDSLSKKSLKVPGLALMRDEPLFPGGREFMRRCLSVLCMMVLLMLGATDSAWAQAYCLPANWWGFDLVNSANGQSTINDKTCGCGSSARYVDSGGACNAAVSTRTSSVASNGDSWSVYTRSDYFSSCSNISDITVTGSCRLTGKSQWYSVVATCSDHNTTATVTMDSTILPLAPCVIQYMADSNNFNPVYVRDEIKFKNAITVTTAAPAYAAIGTSFNVAATALVGSVTISTSGNCTAASTGSGTASITMTGASSDDCVVNYASASDATYGAVTVTSNTNNNYYEGAYAGIKLNFKAFSIFDLLMTCGPTCATTSANSTSWLQAGSGVVAGESANPADTWFVRVATGTGADTTYTIASQINNKCLAKSGSNMVFAACNSVDTAQQWTIAPFNGSDPGDAPAGVEFALPAFPGTWANANIGWGNTYMPIGVSNDHDWTSAFFLGSKSPLPPDHYRFEFNRTAAITCQAMPVTIKACSLPAASDPTCASIYSSSVTMRPTASKGTWSGLTAAPNTSFIGASSGLKLFDATAEATTLGYSSVSVTPIAAPDCYDTSTLSVVSCTNAVTYVNCSTYFDAVEMTSPVSIKGTNLFTKISGTAFGFDVVGPSAYTGNVTVDLIDAGAGTWACGAAATSMSTVTFTAPSSSTDTNTTALSVIDPVTATRRMSFTASSNKTARKVRVRIVDALGNCYNSTDYFSIRPSSLALAVAAVDPGGVATAGTSAHPNGTLGIKTGMTITATAKDGSSNTLTTYAGTPSLNPAKTINDWSSTAISALPNPSTSPPVSPTAAQTLSWVLGSGFGAASSGVATGTFYYNDFGTLSFPADTVVDSSYTNASGDQTADCLANSTANSPDGAGKYGCLVGSAALTTPTFVPDHYEAHLLITPRCAATVGPPATNAFSYMGDPNLGVTVDVIAVNAENGQMYRMWSDWTGTPALPTVAVTADDNGSTIALDAAHSFALPNTAPWKSKASTYDGGFYSAKSASTTTSAAFTTAFVKPTTGPVGPYENFRLTMTLSSGKISSLNGAAVAGAASVSQAAADTTRFRYGILKLDHAYGSELLPLYVPLKVMYWKTFAGPPSYQAWAVNDDDNGCTAVPASRVASGNFRGALSAGTLGAITTTAISYGVGSIRIAKPTAVVTGSADVSVNLGTVATTTDCLTGHLATAAPGTSLSWLRGNWCGGTYGADPTARVTFGAAKSPYLYRREKY